MLAEIIVAVLSLVGTLLGAYAANRRQTALIVYRLEALEKKVEKHNTVIERTYKLEDRANLADAEMNRINHRIGELERSA
ncbi:MAG: hypothetical protein J5922_05235 [Clostridia bacterium]|nr:hypothetical protein [Clostridia bacterium]